MKKKTASASSSGSGNGIKQVLTAALLWCLSASLCLYPANDLQDHTIDEIYFKFHHRIENIRTSKYKPLLHIQRGDPFNPKRLRTSMENLYKVGAFEDIEARVQVKPGKMADIYFVLSSRYVIDSVKVVGNVNPLKQLHSPAAFTKEELKRAVFSLRENSYFEQDNLNKGEEEARSFLKSRGYFNPQVRLEASKDPRHFTVAVKLFVKPRLPAYIGKVNLTVEPAALHGELMTFFTARGVYAPQKYRESIERAKRFLRKQNYYFPEITLEERFPGPSKGVVNLDVSVSPGYRYQFNFHGMKERINLISSVWEKKVFEKWAEKESKARILYFMKNKGYLQAEIESDIKVDENKKVKTITFNITKNRKFSLGKIHIKGNHSIPEKELRRVIETDDLLFNKFFHLRLRSLLVDSEILRFFYYFQGFPDARVVAQPEFESQGNPGDKKKVDITFLIDEGKRLTVDSILFEGNSFFTVQTLTTYMKTQVNGPFVQQRLDEDIEKLRKLYLFYGFDNIEIRPVVSPGTEKSILIRIREGRSYRMGNLIIIGASKQQRNLIAKLFPLDKDKPFDRIKLETFEQDIENSAVFSRFRIVKLPRDNRFMDILINVTADYSRYYGFGIGWEKRKEVENVRATIEYQGRNVFRSYSTFSAMVQVGFKEQRGVLSYDTPYFFRSRVTSSLKLWADREIYPSYEFLRFGIGESLVKKLSTESYVLASLSWYRTNLRELRVPEQGIDKLDTPFDTTALDISFVRESRDDPFNPTNGTFFSTDLKVGFPLFEKDYSFIKFRFNYQKNFKFLRNGVVAVSVRNGLAFGGMSITERFFAGGVNSYRGTYNDRLGPLGLNPNPTTPDELDYNPVGGNALLLFNFETTFPLVIFPVNDFYYSVFADVGNVFDRVSRIDFGSIRTAVGFGIKYKTRMGPLRFDFAWDLGERFSWRNLKIHIGIGNVF